MKKFNISDYVDEDVAMHCDTKEKARIFCEYLHRLGLTWASGTSYLKHTGWSKYKNNTCYNFKKCQYSSICWYIDNGYGILEFDDFDWSDCGYRCLRGNDLLAILGENK